MFLQLIKGNVSDMMRQLGDVHENTKKIHIFSFGNKKRIYIYLRKLSLFFPLSVQTRTLAIYIYNVEFKKRKSRCF